MVSQNNMSTTHTFPLSQTVFNVYVFLHTLRQTSTYLHTRIHFHTFHLIFPHYWGNFEFSINKLTASAFSPSNVLWGLLRNVNTAVDDSDGDDDDDSFYVTLNWQFGGFLFSYGTRARKRFSSKTSHKTTN